jgi:2-polyprenyl-3-methyl-5-hydroxy-6-metoxy-1,4-benzoquinol methylase
MRRATRQQMMRGIIRIIAGGGVEEEDIMPTVDPAKVEELSDRAMSYLSASGVASLVYIGDRLGLYRALRGAGPLTSSQLAEATSLNERWVREWLHGQAAAELIRYDGDGRFELTEEQAIVLADDDNPASVVGGFALLFPLLRQSHKVLESFRTGRGFPYNDHGSDHAIGESRFSAPWMRANLVSNILAGLDGVTAKLSAGARVAEIGCGSGKALVEMARAYPRSEFHGYDSSEIAAGMAEENVAQSGLNNIAIHRAPATAVGPESSFDFILTWDCLHDMADPAAAMHAIRRAIKPDGTWLIVDINGGATPEENYGHPLGPLLYSFSVLDCLPCGTCEEGAAGLGTLGLPEPVARQMTREAGFTRFAVRDFGNPLNAFYEVRP